MAAYSLGYAEVSQEEHFRAGKAILSRVARQSKAEWVKDVTADPDYAARATSISSQIIIPLLSQDRLMGLVSLETDQSDQFSSAKFEFLQLMAARIAVAMDNARLFDRSQRQLDELQNLYEQVRALEQVKTDMIRVVSHDLRNPLTSITTSASLLQRSMQDEMSDRQRRFLERMNLAISQMKTLTTDVLSLEKIEQMA